MKKIKIKVLTLFPNLITSYLKDTLLAKALEKKLFSVEILDLRLFSQNKYNSVDDTICGGGDGMLFQYKPLALAMTQLGVSQKNCSGKKVVYLSPQGQKWSFEKAKEMLGNEEIILVCGRYAGVDERFVHQFVDEEISIGDFVLSGGELAALVMIESMSRHIAGVLGHSLSANLDSFENGLLEAPQFTKPQKIDGLSIPEILLSGNHQKINEWRQNISILVTYKKRPELLVEKKILWDQIEKFYNEMSADDKDLLGLVGLEFKK